MNILQTHNLSKHFGGVYAVDNLSMGFEQGKITGVVGPNGSGKSTLTNLLTGIHKIDAGKVEIDGVRLNKIIPHHNPIYQITRTFQEVKLFEQITVQDNLLVTLTERNIFGALFSRHTKLDEIRTKELLEKVGLWEKRHQLAINLSYGQRKLLEIARVLAMDAFLSSPRPLGGEGKGEGVKVVFLDEPFAGLFKEMIKIVVNIIKEMQEQGKTIVLIEHNMELIRELCDYLYVMDEGKLLAQGKPEKVLAEKKVIEAYLGE
jgi:ABC-type branched-subunit amino acid transport system ATPase component